MLTWLMFAGTILLCGYKSTLLSTLITINYESTIETIADVSNSDLPLTAPKNTAVQKLIETDPRSVAEKIRSKAVYFPFTGIPPPWVNERYYTTGKITFSVLQFTMYTGSRKEKLLEL